MVKIRNLSWIFLFTCLLTAGTAEAKIKKILVIGDSITEGYGIAKDLAFPSLLQKELREKYPEIEVINSGISGSTTASLPSRLPWALKSHPDIIIIALGGNDGLRGVPTTETEKNLSLAIETVQKEKVRVILAGMKLPPNYGSTYRTQFEKIFASLARKYKISFFPFLLEGVGGDPRLNQPDAIHPNEEGHKVIAHNLARFLEPLL